MRKCRDLALFLALFAALQTAPAQEGAGNKEMTFNIGALDNAPRVTVSDVDAGRGEVTLVFERQGMTTFLTEGMFVLIPASPAPKEIFRVQVTDVEPGKGFTIKLAAASIRSFPKGMKLRMVRPMDVSSKQLRAIPEVVPIAAPAAGDGDAGSATEAASLAQSVNNLKRIGLAMANFESANGSLPPAAIVGPDGKPWHSWRTIILPFMEETRIYNEYNFSRPWDDAKNLKAAEKMPKAYRDPIYGDPDSKFANYAAVVGDGSAFPANGPRMKSTRLESFIGDGKGATNIAQITDGTSNTVAIVPVSPDRKIPWTRPEDIAFGADVPAMGSPGGIAVPYHLGGKKDGPGVAPVLILDGSVRLLPASIKPQTLHSLLTIMGGEIIDPKALLTPGVPGPTAGSTLVITTRGGKVTAALR